MVCDAGKARAPGHDPGGRGPRRLDRRPGRNPPRLRPEARRRDPRQRTPRVRRHGRQSGAAGADCLRRHEARRWTATTLTSSTTPTGSSGPRDRPTSIRPSSADALASSTTRRTRRRSRTIVERLRLLYDLGVRIIQLTYNTRNLVGDGCLERTNSGFSTFGMALVERMNEMGILVDVSHCGPATTLEGITASSAGGDHSRRVQGDLRPSAQQVGRGAAGARRSRRRHRDLSDQSVSRGRRSGIRWTTTCGTSTMR